MKQSKAAKIRALLAEGMSVKDIAEKLKVKTDYVHQVRWHWKKAAKQKPEKKTKLGVKYGRKAKAIEPEKTETLLDFLRKRAEDEADLVLQEDQRKQDMVNHPAHYTAGGIETIDFIEAKKLGYNLGNAVKYISRADYKGKRLEDLKKAVFYIQREIDGAQADAYEEQIPY